MSSRYLALRTSVKLVRYKHEYSEISHIANKFCNPRQNFNKSLLNYTDITKVIKVYRGANFSLIGVNNSFIANFFLNCQQSAIPINILVLKNKLSNIFFKFTLRLFQVSEKCNFIKFPNTKVCHMQGKYMYHSLSL